MSGSTEEPDLRADFPDSDFNKLRCNDGKYDKTMHMERCTLSASLPGQGPFPTEKIVMSGSEAEPDLR